MKTIHVWPQEVELADGSVTHSAVVEDAVEDKEPFTVWFRTREEHADLLSSRAETFVASTLYLAMLRGAKLRVHAPLSPSFLRNLDEVQAIWSCWHPNSQLIEIEADNESESTLDAPERAISMFSGGVDSCFTVWRHTQKLCGRRALPLQTSIMVHGSEIPLNRPEMFERALQRSQNMLSEVNVRLVPLATNLFHTFPPEYIRRWFGTLLTSSLLLFQESHTTGLIPASFPYNELVLPFATTPLHDPLFSTSRFAIEHDAANSTRVASIKAIASWSGVLENLRVCNQPEFVDVNCGRCEKCVRTILALRLAGVQNPPCFPNILSDGDIEQISMKGTDFQVFEQMLVAAQEAGIKDSWVKSAQKAFDNNRRRVRWEPMKQRIKQSTPQAIKRLKRF